MAGVVVNTGLQLIAAQGVNKSAQANLVLCLFKSNTTPSAATILSDLTEATFTGYSNVTLTGANWSVTTANPAVATYAQQTFTSSANQSTENIYGYYLKSGTTLVAAERFSDAPNPITNNGDNIKVTPTINLAG